MNNCEYQDCTEKTFATANLEEHGTMRLCFHHFTTLFRKIIDKAVIVEEKA